uniref:2OG-Fe dioxygenase family protein n=1 Tax=Panagrolaimus sp. ES5 TaxID=591445 RepID=A0AC34F2J9_9BILA
MALPSRKTYWQSITSNNNDEDKNIDPMIPAKITFMKQNGYVFLPQKFYYPPSSDNFQFHLDEIKSTFVDLKPDPYSSGNRYRACSDYFYNPEISSFDFYKIPLYQRPEFNAVDGGKARFYDCIDEKLYNNPAFNTLLNKDIDMVKRLEMVKFDESLLLEILQVRYSPGTLPSYSTPSWLHIDDEDVTIVHLIHVDKNIIGGDTVISEDISGKNITKVLRLSKPFDTYMTNQTKFHAVTPMAKADETEDGNENDAEVSRYVFIISFRNVAEDEEVLKYIK